MARKIRIPLPLVALLSLAFASCNCGPGGDGDSGTQSDDGGAKPPPSDTVTCGTLTATAEQGTWSFYPVGDTYGTNTFAVWRIEEDPAHPGSYIFSGDGASVTDVLPVKDWHVPTPVWGAIRLALDGKDPYHFTADDPFYLWYIPYVSGTSWQSLLGSKNDGTCPASVTPLSGPLMCIGRNQLDPYAGRLTSGRTYLVRLSMFIPLGADDHNRVQSCYQMILRL